MMCNFGAQNIYIIIRILAIYCSSTLLTFVMPNMRRVSLFPSHRKSLNAHFWQREMRSALEIYETTPGHYSFCVQLQIAPWSLRSKVLAD